MARGMAAGGPPATAHGDGVHSDSNLVFASTLAGPSNPVSVSLAATFPVKDWERYEFLEMIGQGGMGTVYKARDKRLGRIVALKFIRGDDATLTMRFLQESRAQARIEHPHICKISACGQVLGEQGGTQRSRDPFFDPAAAL